MFITSKYGVEIMVIATASAITFKTEALNVIWAEIEQMRGARDDYRGVVFQQTHHYDISIQYALSWCCMGQEHRYPRALWEDICLSMRLIGQATRDHRLPDIVQLSEDVVWGSTRWAVYPKELRKDFLPVVFRRVDETIFVLREHLEFPSSLVMCPHCGTTMIGVDGSDDMYCPDCRR